MIVNMWSRAQALDCQTGVNVGVAMIVGFNRSQLLTTEGLFEAGNALIGKCLLPFIELASEYR